MAAVDYDVLSAARRVIEGSLGLVRGERVVVVLDSERQDLADALVEAAQWANATAVCFNLDDFAAPLHELPSAVADALAKSQASIYVARSDSAEVGFRRALIETAARLGLRHAHLLGMTRATMALGLAADPQRMAATARALRARLRADSTVALRSAAGSELTVSFVPSHRWVENSGIIRPGRWLNVPAGELLTAPGSVDGTFVADASMTRLGGVADERLAEAPLTLTLAAGRVRHFDSPSSTVKSAVEGYLSGGRNHDRVGLVSFGTNIGLSEPSGTLIVDQTLPGLHLCLGMTLPDLTGADWDAGGQIVLTGSAADIDIDGHAVMRRGRYLL